MKIIKRFEDERNMSKQSIIMKPFLIIKSKEFEEMVNFSDIKKGDIYLNLK
jgi:hypothetical protein